MYNNFKYFLIIFFINLLSIHNTYSNEIFNFDVSEIEVTENGNKIRGLNRGTITTNDGLIIKADTFLYDRSFNNLNAKGGVKIEDKINKYYIYADSITYEKNKEIIITEGNSKIINFNNQTIFAKKIEYNKSSNVINAKGNVLINDPIENYEIEAESISYFKNQNKISTKGKTIANINSRYKIISKDLLYLINSKIIISKKKTQILNQKDRISLDKFHLSLNQNQLKGENILLITNFGLPKSDKLYFSSAIINLTNKSFLAKDAEIKIHKEIFDNSENDPRLKGVSVKGNDQLIELKKAIFTSCKQKDDCPPWSISAKNIKHEKEKKQITYDSAILKIYDFPVLYFPKFFHPDPSVKRQSGVLQPYINNSNTLGSSVQIPYFNVISDNKDNTLFATIFNKSTKMIQNEYRQVNKKSSFIADLGFVRDYKPSNSNKKNIAHLFSKFDVNLDLPNFETSEIKLSLEKVNNDTYLKVFDSVIPNTKVKPENLDLLTSEIVLNLSHENYQFESGIKSFEDLHKSNNDRYQYILPYYNFSKILNEDYFDGFVNFASSGSNDLNDTNNLKSKIINDLSFISTNYISNFGIQNNFSISLKNLNSIGKNDAEYKSTPQIELMGNLDFNSSLPLIKDELNFTKFLIPKLKLKINPSDMKNYSETDRKMNVLNIFSTNRLGLTDSIETGKSLTLGIDYKKENKKDLEKYFEMKLATVFRDTEEEFIPKNSTIGKKNSNLFGSMSNNFNEYLNFNYQFAIDNNYDAFEYNDINATISLNNFVTEFNFIEENGEMGNSNIFENKTSFNFDKNNSFYFKTRKNRKLNLTEYYDLVYEYKNDCLTAGVKYKKTFYEDRALKPSEDLMFTITLFPLTTFQQKID